MGRYVLKDLQKGLVLFHFCAQCPQITAHTPVHPLTVWTIPAFAFPAVSILPCDS